MIGRAVFGRLFSIALFAVFVVPPTESQSYDLCDDEGEVGEPVDAFVGLSYGLLMHVLAEKFCEAPPTPIAPKFLSAVERDGCGPDTSVYLQFEKSVEEAEKYLSGDDPAVQLSSDEIQEATRTIAELGGCETLIEVHNAPISPLVLPDWSEKLTGSSQIDRQ